MVVWIFVVLYLFLGTAIICDELFVPALEVVAEKWQLSDDIAGATLMAAGGSAPELATSLIGTFQRDDVGFGTIIGSAVFNVLFVIAMCAIFTPAALSPLRLTWWPLARDCSYYVVTLAALSVWFSVTTPNVIDPWEAAVQFGLYFGYVLVMAWNTELEHFVKRQLNLADSAPADGDAAGGRASGADKPPDVELTRRDAEMSRNKSTDSLASCESPSAPRSPATQRRSGSRVLLARPTGFRAGIMQLLLGQETLAGTPGYGAVAEIHGDVNATFDGLDANNDGLLDASELRALLLTLGADALALTDAAVDVLRREMDTDDDGFVTRAEFTVWYIQSEERLKHNARWLFEQFDANRDGEISEEEVDALVRALAARHDPAARYREPIGNLAGAADDFRTEVAAAGGTCNFQQFLAWYEKTILWQYAKDDAAGLAEACEGMYTTTMRNVKGLRNKPVHEAATVILLLPLNLSLALTVPDCRVPGNEGWCYATFALSIGWIGGYAYLLVLGVTKIGEQLGIPLFIMALTFLAAGTSVPDLLSSVVVAKQGKGDMAVSSSIGSNIFDVSVGLPLPWLAFTFVHGCPVQVGGSPMNNAVSVLVLLAMVFLVVTSIAACGWEMSKSLGAIMFGLYFAYCGQEIYRAT
mmetsp:Transcript_8281/g.27248  ORF Transcript_8281/g.27248 Transcript_8281/m.27248 type:complete len:640 (+) Transcript_8281:623-2542(+)